MSINRSEKRSSRSRGRPTEFDRGTAVQAAMHEFWKRGFDAVAATDLSDAMGITRSSLYNSFGDRESVFREALVVYRQFAPDAALAEIEKEQPVVPAVRKVFREICRVRAADPDGKGCLVINSIGELVGVNKQLGGRIEEAVWNTARIYEDLIRRAVDQGEIDKPDDIRATARAFVAFACGLNTISKVIRAERELWRLSEVFLRSVGFSEASRTK